MRKAAHSHLCAASIFTATKPTWLPSLSLEAARVKGYRQGQKQESPGGEAGAGSGAGCSVGFDFGSAEVDDCFYSGLGGGEVP